MAKRRALKDALLAPRLKQQEVDIPDVGTVVVRALSRGEVQDIYRQGQTANGMDATLVEQLLVAKALVEPQLTPEEVKQWYLASPAHEIQVVVDAVLALSGLSQEERQRIEASFHQAS